MSLCATTLSVGEKFSLGGVTTLLGLGMTFLVLVLLIGCIFLVSFLIGKLGIISFKKKTSVPMEKSVKPVEERDSSEPIDEETMLAVSAAVQTYVRESATDGKPHENVKIKSVVRK